MNEQYKELLFIDLCGRLPYKVRMFEIEPINDIQSNLTLQSITNKESVICITPSGGVIGSSIDAFKPYLFPLSSMTEEQKEEIEDKLIFPSNSNGGWIEILYNDKYNIPFWFVDFCNKNHFDYRGLIEKGLAIDATNLNIY